MAPINENKRTNMQAIAYEKYGSPEVLRLREMPRPDPGPGQVLLRVRAAALNPIDCEIRRGRLRLLPGSRFPRVPGSDFAGEVVERGSGLDRFRPGDKVYGMSRPLRGGSYAEFMTISADEIARIPESLSWAEAASLPLVALTALQALRDLAGISAHDRLFIHGGSGGVGTAAIQIGKYLGAGVTTTCSYRNVNLCRQMGADEVIDYTKTDVRKVAGGYSIFFDVYGNMPFGKIKQLLRPGGVHVSTIPSPANFLQAFLTRWLPGKTAKVVVVRPDADDLELISEMVEKKALRPVIDRRYPLAEAARAQAFLETKRAKGKVVLEVAT